MPTARKPSQSQLSYLRNPKFQSLDLFSSFGGWKEKQEWVRVLEQIAFQLHVLAPHLPILLALEPRRPSYSDSGLACGTCFGLWHIS